MHGYTATLIVGNEDDLYDSDCLSSWSVLAHCTALYVPVPYKDVSRMHYDGAHTTGAYIGLG